MDDFAEPQSPRVTDSSSKAPSLATMLSQIKQAKTTPTKLTISSPTKTKISATPTKSPRKSSRNKENVDLKKSSKSVSFKLSSPVVETEKENADDGPTIPVDSALELVELRAEVTALKRELSTRKKDAENHKKYRSGYSKYKTLHADLQTTLDEQSLKLEKILQEYQLLQLEDTTNKKRIQSIQMELKKKHAEEVSAIAAELEHVKRLLEAKDNELNNNITEQRQQIDRVMQDNNDLKQQIASEQQESMVIREENSKLKRDVDSYEQLIRDQKDKFETNAKNSEELVSNLRKQVELAEQQLHQAQCTAQEQQQRIMTLIVEREDQRAQAVQNQRQYQQELEAQTTEKQQLRIQLGEQKQKYRSKIQDQQARIETLILEQGQRNAQAEEVQKRAEALATELGSSIDSFSRELEVEQTRFRELSDELELEKQKNKLLSNDFQSLTRSSEQYRAESESVRLELASNIETLSASKLELEDTVISHQETISSLNSLNAELKQLVQRQQEEVEAIAKERSALSEQLSKAIQFRAQVEEELKRQEARYEQLVSDRKSGDEKWEQQVTVLKNIEKELTAKLATEEKSVAALNQERENLELHVQELQLHAESLAQEKELFEVSVQEQVKILESQVSVLSGSNEQAASDRAQLESTLEQLNEQMQCLLVEQQELRQQISTQQALEKRLSTQVSSQETEIAKAQRVIEAQKQQLTAAVEENTKITSSSKIEIQALEKQIAVLTTEKQDLSSQLQKRDMRLVTVTAEKNRLAEQLEHAEQALRDEKKKLVLDMVELRDTCQAQLNQIDELSGQREQLSNDIVRLAQERDAGAVAIEELNQQNSELNQKIEQLSSQLDVAQLQYQQDELHLETRIEHMNNEKNDLQREINDRVDESNELRSQYEEYRVHTDVQMQQLLEQVSRYQDRVQSLLKDSDRLGTLEKEIETLHCSKQELRVQIEQLESSITLMTKQHEGYVALLMEEQNNLTAERDIARAQLVNEQSMLESLMTEREQLRKDSVGVQQRFNTLSQKHATISEQFTRLKTDSAEQIQALSLEKQLLEEKQKEHERQITEELANVDKLRAKIQHASSVSGKQNVEWSSVAEQSNSSIQQVLDELIQYQTTDPLVKWSVDLLGEYAKNCIVVNDMGEDIIRLTDSKCKLAQEVFMLSPTRAASPRAPVAKKTIAPKAKPKSRGIFG